MKDAIGLDSTVDSIVRGNRILKIGTPAWAGAGVRCEGQSAVVLATAVQIAGNTVTDYTTVGVKFENAEGCTARDNRVGFGGGANAIELGADAYSCAVEDNTIVDTTAGTYNGIRVWGDKNFISGNTTNIGGTGAGIELVTGASFNIVTGNQTMNNGITDGGTSTTLANNRDDA